MSSKKHVLHGCSVCGGKVNEGIDTLALLVGGQTLLISNVTVGECERCGAKYHPAQTARAIDQTIQEALEDRLITKRHLKSLRIVSERDLIAGKVGLEQEMLKRLKKLERKVEQLAAILAA
jgi:YgiT-type zinc finger domain-containing protein